MVVKVYLIHFPLINGTFVSPSDCISIISDSEKRNTIEKTLSDGVTHAEEIEPSQSHQVHHEVKQENVFSVALEDALSKDNPSHGVHPCGSCMESWC
jgi:hypothetical protein